MAGRKAGGERATQNPNHTATCFARHAPDRSPRRSVSQLIQVTAPPEPLVRSRRRMTRATEGNCKSCTRGPLENPLRSKQVAGSWMREPGGQRRHTPGFRLNGRGEPFLARPLFFCLPSRRRRHHDVERATVDAARVNVLDRRRLAGRLVDRKDHERVFATREDLLALDPGGEKRSHDACRLDAISGVRGGLLRIPLELHRLSFNHDTQPRRCCASGPQ